MKTWPVHRMDLPDPPYRDGISISGIVLPGRGLQCIRITPVDHLVGRAVFLFMLARYYPRVWSDLLDVDWSTHAVPTATALELAQSVVPSLVVDLLAGIYRRNISEGPA